MHLPSIAVILNAVCVANSKRLFSVNKTLVNIESHAAFLVCAFNIPFHMNLYVMDRALRMFMICSTAARCRRGMLSMMTSALASPGRFQHDVRYLPPYRCDENEPCPNDRYK